MIWYEVDMQNNIKEVDVVRETACYIIKNTGERLPKRSSDFNNYFKTKKEAEEFIEGRKELPFLAMIYLECRNANGCKGCIINKHFGDVMCLFASYVDFDDKTRLIPFEKELRKKWGRKT